MSRTATSLLAKFEDESDTFAATFTLAEGETIASCTAVMSLVWGADAAVADMVASAVTISGDTVTVLIESGTHGNIYRLRFTATTSTGRILVDDTTFEVRA